MGIALLASDKVCTLPPDGFAARDALFVLFHPRLIAHGTHSPHWNYPLLMLTSLTLCVKIIFVILFILCTLSPLPPKCPWHRGRRYGIFPKNEYFYWMINQIFFGMNQFFELIYLPYDWMNQKSVLFIRKMNKKCLFWTERAPFACFSLFFTVFSSCDLFSNLNE